MTPDNADRMLRLSAVAAAAVVAVTLVSAVVGSMPPPLAAPDEARNGATEIRTEVAIVPARIEVIGHRGAPTVAVEDARPAPRS